jgi:hypothetical protein
VQEQKDRTLALVDKVDAVASDIHVTALEGKEPPVEPRWLERYSPL